MSAEVEVVLIAMVTAAAAALPGVFLVLRKMAMVSDAITHAVLPGIVVAFFVTRDLDSPLLLVAAATTGVVTVALIELVHRTGLVPSDAAIALVFPALFSVGVILVSRHAGDVHLDTDAVLLGELAFAPFDRLTMAGLDLGPAALWSMGTILLLDAAVLVLLRKELTLATMDAGLAAVLGFSPVVLHYGLMTLVSVTAVGAFSAVGSILVVALMIAPPAAAYLLVERIHVMLWLSPTLAAASALAGCAAAFALDVSIAGAMAVASGAVFALAFAFAPRRGLLSQARRRRARRLEFAVRMLLVHLLHHEGSADAMEECRPGKLDRHLRWSEPFVRQVVRTARSRELVELAADGLLRVTGDGRRLGQAAIAGRV